MRQVMKYIQELGIANWPYIDFQIDRGGKNITIAIGYKIGERI